MIGSDTSIKPFWHLARVTEVIAGSDGKIRSAKVKKSDGTYATYPICKLYPLEISLMTVPKIANVKEETGEEKEERPVRKAALRCKEKLRGSN